MIKVVLIENHELPRSTLKQMPEMDRVSSVKPVPAIKGNYD